LRPVRDCGTVRVVVPRHAALHAAVLLTALPASAQNPPSQQLPTQNQPPAQNLPGQTLPSQNPLPEQTLPSQQLPTQNQPPAQNLPNQALPSQNPLPEQTLPAQKLPTQKPPPVQDQPVPSGIDVKLHVGQKKVLNVGLAMGLSCDDGAIVHAELRAASDTVNQLVLKGLKPGHTVCSAGTANVSRLKVVNITVVPKPAPKY